MVCTSTKMWEIRRLWVFLSFLFVCFSFFFLRLKPSGCQISLLSYQRFKRHSTSWLEITIKKLDKLDKLVIFAYLRRFYLRASLSGLFFIQRRRCSFSVAKMFYLNIFILENFWTQNKVSNLWVAKTDIELTTVRSFQRFSLSVCNKTREQIRFVELNSK